MKSCLDQLFALKGQLSLSPPHLAVIPSWQDLSCSQQMSLFWTVPLLSEQNPDSGGVRMPERAETSQLHLTFPVNFWVICKENTSSSQAFGFPDICWTCLDHRTTEQTLCLPEVSPNKNNWFKPMSRLLELFYWALLVSDHVLCCLPADWGRSAEKKRVNPQVRGTQSHHLQVLQTKTPRGVHPAGTQKVWNLFCTQKNLPESSIIAVYFPLSLGLHSAKAALN